MQGQDVAIDKPDHSFMNAQDRPRRTVTACRADSRANGAWPRSLAAVAALLGLMLSGCEGNILDPAGPIAAGEKTILLNATAIMLCIIVPIIIATPILAWWFREGNDKAIYLPEWAFSGRVEMLIWSVPFITIVFLGGIAWVGSHELDPAKPIASTRKPLEIQVVSLDWKWLFIYPEQKVAAINQLVIPTGTPVHFQMTSSGVWNSFYVAQLGSQIYTMKGMAVQLYLMADRDGDYLGLSTHYSGDGFSDMNFRTHAVSDAAFNDWIKAAQANGHPLDEPTYNDLAKQSIGVPPSTFASVAPDLFEKVVMEKVPAGPGPATGTQGGPQVTPKGGT